MPYKINPPGTPLPPDHPFATPQILFGGKPKTSSPKSSPPEETSPSASTPSEELMTGMDDPCWMQQAQNNIDQDALEHFLRIGKMPPKRKP
jgi:hypothetical protein